MLVTVELAPPTPVVLGPEVVLVLAPVVVPVLVTLDVTGPAEVTEPP